MSNRVYFDGDGSYGTLGSTISLLDGESLSCNFRANLASGGAGVYDLVANTAEDDRINIQSTSSTQMRYKIEIAGSTYISGDVTPTIFDGENHTLDFARSGSNFLVTVDGTLVATISASSGVFDIDTVIADGFPCEISNLEIGDLLFDATDIDGTSWPDSTATTEITLTGATKVCVSAWEWVGDFTHIERTYATQNGSVSERRREGTRKRTVVGYPMESLLNKQAGTELDQDSDGVLAYNGGQISALKPIVLLIAPFTGTIDCDIEVFTPVTGTNFFTQTQTWVSYINSYPT